ncbi:MAG TPA: hypothetical protein EYP81_05520 [Thermodesulfobacteriaceae bacterium]|nr:hypothetical protein [Thermodesulfobacteriaceae bacterium]
MEAGIEGLQKILKAYQAYFRTLAFQELPRITWQLLGEVGFGIVAEALAKATIAALPSLIDAVKGLVEVRKGDPLDVLFTHFDCHSKAREITGDEQIGLFKPRREGSNRLVLEGRCPFEFKDNPLVLASYAGIVVGVLRALGQEAHAVSKRELLKKLKRGYGVYAEEENGVCRIIVEKVD